MFFKLKKRHLLPIRSCGKLSDFFWVLTMRSVLIFQFSILILFLFQNCSYTEIKKTSPEINIVKNGENFMIILPENHSEQLMWKLDDKHNKNCIEYINSVFHGNEKGVYYNFKALQKGQDTLHFALYKYNDVTKILSYIVKVN